MVCLWIPRIQVSRYRRAGYTQLPQRCVGPRCCSVGWGRGLIVTTRVLWPTSVFRRRLPHHVTSLACVRVGRMASTARALGVASRSASLIEATVTGFFLPGWGRVIYTKREVPCALGPALVRSSIKYHDARSPPEGAADTHTSAPSCIDNSGFAMKYDTVRATVRSTGISGRVWSGKAHGLPPRTKAGTPIASPLLSAHSGLYRTELLYSALCASPPGTVCPNNTRANNVYCV